VGLPNHSDLVVVVVVAEVAMLVGLVEGTLDVVAATILAIEGSPLLGVGKLGAVCTGGGLVVG